MELLKYKRELYFDRDGLTPEVEALDREINSIQNNKVRFPKKVTLTRSLEIDDDDYQMDVDTALSLVDKEK